MNDSRQPGPFYLGVDGGGSKTHAIILDSRGNICGQGFANSSNYSSVSLEQALLQISIAINLAAQAAGCALPFQAAWLGLAGVDSPTDLTTISPHLRYIAQEVHLTNDAELALCALPGTVGVALIAGTGSIALSRDLKGQTKRVGGWGHLLGDEGSGYDIGRLGLQAALRQADGRGPETSLLNLILEHWQINDHADILGRVYPDFDKAKIARLASLVFKAWQNGDEVARHIVQYGITELALTVTAVCKDLDFPANGIPLAFAGGLLVNELDFREQLRQRIAEQHTIGEFEIVTQPALSAAKAALTLPGLSHTS